eukprot:1387333-Amorphochlora_amoeboformis.AAC.2
MPFAGHVRSSQLTLPADNESYKDNKVVGWYCTGDKPAARHSGLHEVIKDWYGLKKGKIIAQPLFLMMNAEAKMTDEGLPITIYGDKMKTQKYTIKSDIAETVAVVHCAQEDLENKKGSKRED